MSRLHKVVKEVCLGGAALGGVSVAASLVAWASGAEVTSEQMGSVIIGGLLLMLSGGLGYAVCLSVRRGVVYWRWGNKAGFWIRRDERPELFRIVIVLFAVNAGLLAVFALYMYCKAWHPA